MVSRYYNICFVVLSIVGTIPLVGSDEVKHPPIEEYYVAKKVVLHRCINTGALLTGIVYGVKNKSIEEFYSEWLPRITVGVGSAAKAMIRNGNDLKLLHNDVGAYVEERFEGWWWLPKYLIKVLYEQTKLECLAGVGYGIGYIAKYGRAKLTV